MNAPSRQTPLHQWHVEHQALMADFGGYDMPLWYSSAKNEHIFVLTGAGLFDTSHMAFVTVDGKDAFDLLQWCFSKDLSACIGPKKTALAAGRCVYGVFLDEKGWVIDDAIVYRLGENAYMAVINAGMGGVIADHLEAHKNNRDAAITDLTDRLGKIDIQGPAAAKILEKILENPDEAFEKMFYFSFKGYFADENPYGNSILLYDGTPVLLSRTGYTGEFGFELYLQPDRLVSTWEMLMNAGEDFQLTACGLAARDSLRASAMLPLSHQDIGHWLYRNHPWPFALPWNESEDAFTKTFLGSDALLGPSAGEFTHAFAGKDVRKVSLPAKVLNAEGEKIGDVLTCVTDMAAGWHEGQLYCLTSPDKPEGFKAKGISCGFVKVNRMLSPGEVLTLKDERRGIPVTVVNDIRPNRTARAAMKSMR